MAKTLSQYKGITEKKLKDGSTCIMVRFKYLGITYPIKNFTKLYGCTKKSEALSKLGEVKTLLSQNIDPFKKSLETFAEIYEDKLNTNEANGTWAYYTVKNRRHFFNKYIKDNKNIGKKRVENITYDDIKGLLQQFNNGQSSSINTAIDILRPVFKEAFDKGIIVKNILLSDEFKKKRYATKKVIEARTRNSAVEIVRGLYEAIPLYGRDQALYRNIEIHKMFLYMILMTAHRSGEIIQLRKEHCDLKQKKIYAPKEITKTKDYQFPIPDECFEYIKNHEGGLLFPIPKGGTIDRVFKRLVELAEIDLIANQQISGHDTRRLLMTIMVEELKIDSNVADYCLEHEKQGVMAHYLNLSYKIKEETFKKYWEFIRQNNFEENISINNTISNTNEKTLSNMDKLEKLIEMLEKNYITQEQFEYERDKLYN